MSKRQILLALGVWVMLFLFLGLTTMWHQILAVITGLVIVVISYNLAPQASKEKKSDHQDTFQDSFTENK